VKRVLTALVAIQIVLTLTLFAPDWAFALSVGFVAALAAEEFMGLGGACGIGRPGKWFVLPVAMVGASFMGGADWVLTSLGFSVLLLLTVGVFSGTLESALARSAIGLGALLYCGFTLGFLVLLPRELVLLLFAIIWVGDSAAYYGGRAFGRHPLAPRISPKKTIEGAIAGLAGSMLVGGFAGVLFLGEPWLSVTLISGATAVLGQIGDLAESAMKRSAGVKDSSSILPGHGGILDRLDSLFFAAPVFYWLFNL
jgi:phosphatidate cytidylyltransferase